MRGMCITVCCWKEMWGHNKEASETILRSLSGS
jgi:hypothetical protein